MIFRCVRLFIVVEMAEGERMEEEKMEERIEEGEGIKRTRQLVWQNAKIGFLFSFLSLL